MTKKNKTILTATALVIAMTVAVTLAVRHYSKPNFAKMTPQQIRRYFDSNEFRDANEDKRREAFEQMRDVMETRMVNQANEYAALSADQKTVYLDKIIDEMEARRAEFLAREANDVNRPDVNDPNRFGFGRRGPNMGQRPRVNPERRRERSSRVSADSMVKMMQFRQDMMNRMQERGIQMGPGRGGFGGPGGGGPPPGR